MKSIELILGAALASGVSSITWADGNLPPIQHAGAIAYVSGGIGLDESSAMRAAAKDFSLALLFAQTKRGEYLAEVKVRISDKSGNTVLETVAEGPMLLARLPAGEYKIVAEYAGEALTRTLKIGASGSTRAGFVWKPAGKASID